MPPSSPLDAEFLDRLGTLLAQLGGSAGAAGLTGRDARTLRHYQNGRSTIPLDIAAALCRAGGKSLDWLAFGCEVPPAPSADSGPAGIRAFIQSPWGEVFATALAWWALTVGRKADVPDEFDVPAAIDYATSMIEFLAHAPMPAEQIIAFFAHQAALQWPRDPSET
jgi:hypothetical protein